MELRNRFSNGRSGASQPSIAIHIRRCSWRRAHQLQFRWSNHAQWKCRVESHGHMSGGWRCLRGSPSKTKRAVTPDPPHPPPPPPPPPPRPPPPPPPPPP